MRQNGLEVNNHKLSFYVLGTGLLRMALAISISLVKHGLGFNDN